jgi:hypothetical protein
MYDVDNSTNHTGLMRCVQYTWQRVNSQASEVVRNHSNSPGSSAFDMNPEKDKPHRT